jgi:hypothetical protein
MLPRGRQHRSWKRAFVLARLPRYVRRHHVALLALFIALGGTAWALDVNSVKSKHIVNGEVRNPDLRDGSVDAAKLDTSAEFTSLGLPDAFGGCGAVGDTWASFSPDVNQTVSYHRDPAGIVHLRGIAVKCNAASNTGLVLPAGARPGKLEIFGPLFSFGHGRLNVESSGVLAPVPISSPGSWVSLNGITFRCGPSGQNGCP